jgi:AcrR family transcriptional regulator
VTAKPRTPATRKGGVPAQERELRAQGQKTMKRLLDAGEWVFERRGFHAARVDDVVKRAKTSHGTFYLYFSNKEDLFKALALVAMDDMATLADTLPDFGSVEDPRGELRAWVTSFFNIYASHGTVIKSWTENSSIDNELGVAGTRLLRVIGAALGKHIPERPGLDPETAGMALLSMLERVNYLLQTGQIKHDREVMLETITTAAWDGFLKPA